jgi:hypothetical protein
MLVSSSKKSLLLTKSYKKRFPDEYADWWLCQLMGKGLCGFLLVSQEMGKCQDKHLAWWNSDDKEKAC